MPALVLHFPGGRYHATPWGHHVNEGLVEWPPSPWRVLRALIACGYATQRWGEIPAAGKRLFEALAGTLPRYALPEASIAHSRHFMPLAVLDNGREKTTLVFDTWADVGHGTIAVKWDCILDEEATSLLRTLAAHLGYLGRSESWVEAELVDGEITGADAAYPHTEGHHGERGWEQVSLMAPDRPNVFQRWRDESVAKALEAHPLPVGKKKVPDKLMKARQAAVAAYPTDLLDALQRDTAWWKSHGWSQPPGSRHVLYWRRSGELSVGTEVRALHPEPQRVPAMLLALTTPSGLSSALPRVERVLPQAELLHRVLVKKAAGSGRVDCPELTGKDASGKPLSGHQHAHVLPVDLDDDGCLDHVIIYAPMGLGATAQAAIREIKRTWTKGGVGELQVALAGQGGLDDLRALPDPFGKGVRSLLGPSRVWESRTPLVLPRFQKPRGRNSLAGQVESELASRHLPAAAVTVLPWDDRTRHLRHSVRVRRPPAPAPAVDACCPIRLVFEEPVPGPIVLGYASHFGLGLFAACKDNGP